jgi:hypothetical protein
MKNLNNYIFISLCILFVSCSSKKAINISQIVEHVDGNKIYLKEGGFIVDEPIILDSKSRLIGNNTILIPSKDHPYPLIKINNSHDIVIDNVQIECPELKNIDEKIYLQKGNYKYGIEIKLSSDIEIVDCSFENLIGTGLKVLDSKEINISHSTFKNIGLSTYKGIGYSYDGIYLGGKSYVKNIKIDSCLFENIGMSFPSGTDPWPNDGDGIHILTPGIAQNISITNCYFNKCSARGVKIQSGQNVSITNNVFKGGKNAVGMPMLKSINNIKIDSNQIFGTLIPFSTNKSVKYEYAVDLQITNNTIDSCLYFFRTDGTSNVRNGIIKNNIIGTTGYFVLSGRFYDSEISNNRITKFATAGHYSWKMAFLLLKESENVTIKNNVFGSIRKGTRILDNRSINNIIIKNNIEGY